MESAAADRNTRQLYSITRRGVAGRETREAATVHQQAISLVGVGEKPYGNTRTSGALGVTYGVDYGMEYEHAVLETTGPLENCREVKGNACNKFADEWGLSYGSSP